MLEFVCIYIAIDCTRCVGVLIMQCVCLIACAHVLCVCTCMYVCEVCGKSRQYVIDIHQSAVIYVLYTRYTHLAGV